MRWPIVELTQGAGNWFDEARPCVLGKQLIVVSMSLAAAGEWHWRGMYGVRRREQVLWTMKPRRLVAVTG